MSTRTDTSRAPSRSRSAPGTRPARGAAPKRRSAPAGSPARPTRTARVSKGGQERAPRIPFVLLILCLLSSALVGLLVLRSVVAQEAYAITSLQSENRELSYEEQQLRDTVANLESSERIADEAEDMGMEEGEAPRFLDPENGEITGDAGRSD